MRRVLGFTLIELMITGVVIAILTAIAYPSYLDYIRRGIRSQGQQFLVDLAQRQEQYLLDQRAYATTVGAGGLGMTFPAPCTVPCEIQGKYNAAGITIVAGPTPAYRIVMAPVTGSTMASDGTLIIDNTQARWRTNNAASTTYNSATDCRWEETRCKPAP